MSQWERLSKFQIFPILNKKDAFDLTKRTMNYFVKNNLRV